MTSYTSINIDPNGSTPPSSTIAQGSINHFFSGMGLGTVLIRQGLSGWPEMFRPRMAPTIVNGRITNRQIQATETYGNKYAAEYVKLEGGT